MSDPDYLAEDDALYEQAAQLVRDTQAVSISKVQRHLRIGYNRAARLVEQLEINGVVSAPDLKGERAVCIPVTEAASDEAIPNNAGDPAPPSHHRMNEKKHSNIVELIGDLDAGVFAAKLEHALHAVAEGVVTTGRAGKVSVTFDIKQIASSHQVAVKHKLAFVRPTNNGRRTEENTTETPLHVGVAGKLTLYPESQPDMFRRESAD